MALNVNENKFILPINIAAAGKVTKELQTAGTYVDKNIAIEVNTPDGSLEVKKQGDLSASVSVDTNIYTSDTETNYPITVRGDATITDVQIGVANEGFIDSTDTVTINGNSAQQVSKTVYIKAGSLSSSSTTSAAGGNGLVLGAKQASAPESGFYVKASTAGDASVETAGWVDETTPSVSVNDDSYYLIDAATLANAGNADKVYAEKTGPVLVSGDYLYINKGYIEDTKISLADLVPNEATVKAGVNGNSHLIYNTVSVYDKDGELVAGTMGDSTHTIESQPVNAVEPTVDVSFSVKKGDTEIELLTDIPEGEYLTIGAAGFNTEGSLSTTISCSSTKGYVSENDTKTVNIDETINAMISNPANKYIKIYAGEIIDA